ncbi:2-oxoglutarate dehydrogenase complex dihydrolipoyllysine-residue succinyltransferase [Advenella alkanexedens]|jgi:2-oxoglutarate dehydrogenase E2 component (dihydrolipoamide succinyltransferase)|uniref:Dihydrolipoyllysine-residue succinyltransferase component of 2-oxoglutarate dehydrogenase complex n=1 Tax=Advenella alkanexedens TaxID=1481665 RepID=A0ABS6NMX1_9BURK|nr:MULTISPECIES: 2-oxoglutarate dehydrogenase complex dihydrolipoyllysine-residue succinyltransferase [Advenella]MBV4396974.1 2-oxoglutarate dehydrogenase complex dihydrolipoyllysine-residue succinyltransferase [Advenella alkanexedens]MDD3756666.1 2-oxoglutarate dehydrogenase complex dihydrolipoyllysine-residue succinyltransferase [Advenella sp.]NLN68121.1 2-oxoglutarate dehydrogenase complex dihydrolipoyllysine-residue succinyltransferase [Alcaligenaceae bacterium]WKU20569.1 2-oxoglutarate deh
MAIIDVIVPQLSESISEATLLEWKKKVGEAVTQDETLIEVETDKVVLEVPAPASGVIVEIVEGDGSTVTAEQLLAKIDTEATVGVAAAPAAAEAAPAVAAPAAAESKTVSGVASPAASKILSEKGISAADVAGSGRDGRVTKADAVAASAPAKSVAAPAAPLSVSLDGRPEQRVPMTRLRARVAERLLQSQSENAILTTFNEVNMKAVIDLRNKYKEKFEKEHGIKLGFMSFFVKAAVAALKKYPILNASVDGKDIVYHGYFDIGIAVGSPRGLVVPILRNADQMSIADIEKKIAEFGAKARDGKLTLDELTGGTFSISNGGTFGSMLSTPIINPPQSAILGIHATKDRAVVENGQVVIRPINFFAMSYDHRIIDGREAVLGLVAMKEALEDPQRLLLDL